MRWDRYNDQHSTLDAKFLSEGNLGGAEHNALISLRKTVNTCLLFLVSLFRLPPLLPSLTRPHADTTSGKIGFNENATLPFEPGKPYRLCAVNTAGFLMFFFWTEGYEMQIIAVNGVSWARL